LHKPHLTFFCELERGALRDLLAEPNVVATLRALGAGVSLGLIDLSAERAKAVRALNAAGIPVTAWLLLPREEGYWFNLDNAPQAMARYAAFREWTAAFGLRWASVGLDVETDIRDMDALLTRGWRALPRLARRALQCERLRRGLILYRALVERIRADEYPVESYQFPIIVDERRAGSTLLQRVLGVADLAVDREVLMLYSSFVSVGLLWSYARDAGAIGVGSTGGGVELAARGELAALGWGAFARDLRLAARRAGEVYIFSLEGCVRQGFLPLLLEFDWDAPVGVPVTAALRVDRVRAVLRGALWLSAHPGVIAAVLGALVSAGWLVERLVTRRPG